MQNKDLSIFLNRMVPSFILDEYSAQTPGDPSLELFLKYFFEFLGGVTFNADGSLANLGPVTIVQNLLDFNDVDDTMTDFLVFFKNKYAQQYPFIGKFDVTEQTSSMAIRSLVKKIHEFYLAKGSLDSIRFFFRSVFDKEINIYYPKDDMLRLSDGRWFEPYYLGMEHLDGTELTASEYADLPDRYAVGLTSGTRGYIDSTPEELLPNAARTLTGVKWVSIVSKDGSFDEGEQVQIVDGITNEVLYTFKLRDRGYSTAGAGFPALPWKYKGNWKNDTEYKIGDIINYQARTFNSFDIILNGVANPAVVCVRATEGAGIDPVGNVVYYEPANVVRSDYDVNGNPKGVIVESAATNLFLYNRDFYVASWNAAGASGGIGSDATIAPTGSQSADEIFQSATTTTHGRRQSVVITAAQYTVSFYAKAGGARYVQLYGSGQTSDAGNTSAVWDLETGVVVSGTGTPKIEEFANGWYRCSRTYTFSTAGAYGFQIAPCNATGTQTILGDTSLSVSLWGAQLELGGTATSPIRTADIAVTRDADTLQILDLKLMGFNTTQGTMLTEATLADYNAYQSMFSFTHNDYLEVGYTFGQTNEYFAQASAGGFTSGVTTPATFYKGVTYKYASAYKRLNMASSVQGVLTEAETCDFTGLANRMYIGVRAGDGTYRMRQGWIKNMRYYPDRLSNTEMRSMTGSGFDLTSTANDGYYIAKQEHTSLTLPSWTLNKTYNRASVSTWDGDVFFVKSQRTQYRNPKTPNLDPDNWSYMDVVAADSSLPTWIGTNIYQNDVVVKYLSGGVWRSYRLDRFRTRFSSVVSPDLEHVDSLSWERLRNGMLLNDTEFAGKAWVSGQTYVQGDFLIKDGRVFRVQLNRKDYATLITPENDSAWEYIADVAVGDPATIWTPFQKYQPDVFVKVQVLNTSVYKKYKLKKLMPESFVSNVEPILDPLRWELLDNEGNFVFVQAIDFTTRWEKLPNTVDPERIGVGNDFAGRWIGTDGFISSNKKIQDSFFYQDFSYQISVDLDRSVFLKALIDNVHPAGFQVFNVVENVDILIAYDLGVKEYKPNISFSIQWMNDQVVSPFQMTILESSITILPQVMFNMTTSIDYSGFERYTEPYEMNMFEEEPFLNFEVMSGSNNVMVFSNGLKLPSISPESLEAA